MGNELLEYRDAVDPLSKYALYQWDATPHRDELMRIARRWRTNTPDVFNLLFADVTQYRTFSHVSSTKVLESSSPELRKFREDILAYREVASDLFIEHGMTGPNTLQLLPTFKNSSKLLQPTVYLTVNVLLAGEWALKQLRELHRTKMGGR